MGTGHFLERTSWEDLNNGNVFSINNKPKKANPNQIALTIYNFQLLFSIHERLEKLANDKEIYDIPLWSEREEHLWK